MLSAGAEVRAELALRAARDWAKSWAFLRGEAVLREMARPCGSGQSQLSRGAWPSVAERGRASEGGAGGFLVRRPSV